MASIEVFPFGQPVRNVTQADRTPKSVFVLGVYASAVHARWIGLDKKTIVNALAVASEPYIFWRGEDPESIIGKIAIPTALGRFVPADPQFNGPSGRALDELILAPLGLKREDAWLCDLVPRSCVNPSQGNAIRRAYIPFVEQYQLPIPTVSSVPSILADHVRRARICDELRASCANTVILLGDLPIKWFLKYFDSRWNRLTDLMRNGQPYGKLCTSEIEGRTYNILPLAHPRQIAKLGQSSLVWFKRHQAWVCECADKNVFI